MPFQSLLAVGSLWTGLRFVSQQIQKMYEISWLEVVNISDIDLKV